MNLEQLEKFVLMHKPFLVDATSKIKQYSKTHPLILRSNGVCGAVTQSLSFLYEQFSIPYMVAHFHQSYKELLICDHVTPIVNVKDFGLVSTDGAYYQFIDVFGFSSDDMPKEDILFVPELSLDSAIDQFSKMHNKLKSLPAPDEDSISKFFYDMTEIEFINYCDTFLNFNRENVTIHKNCFFDPVVSDVYDLLVNKGVIPSSKDIYLEGILNNK